MNNQLPPLDDLDRAFKLPEHISEESPELGHLFEVMVIRLRREAQHVGLPTLQLLLIERVANLYVQMKYLEETQGWTKASEQKDFNTFWLAIATELGRNMRGADAEAKQHIVQAMANVVLSVIKTEISDEAEQSLFKQKLANALVEAGL